MKHKIKMIVIFKEKVLEDQKKIKNHFPFLKIEKLILLFSSHKNNKKNPTQLSIN